MWRNPLTQMAPRRSVLSASRNGAELVERRRVSERRRRRVADALLRAARRSAPSARVSRSELLLTTRAATVRSELLELAALVRTLPDPDPAAISTLHALLTDGCTSPLFNEDVPADRLKVILNRVHAALGTAADLGCPDVLTVPSTISRKRRRLG